MEQIKKALFNLGLMCRMGNVNPKISHELDKLNVAWGIQNQVAYISQFSDLYMNTIVSGTLKGFTVDDFRVKYNLDI